MVMLDANMVLRYLLNDNEKMADEAARIIEEAPVLVTIEIIAEVVYVLKGVYAIGRDVIKTSLSNFLSEVHTDEPDVLKLGLAAVPDKHMRYDSLFTDMHKAIESVRKRERAE